MVRDPRRRFARLALEVEREMPEFLAKTVPADDARNGLPELDANEWPARRFVSPDARILLVDDVKTNLLSAAECFDEYRCQVDTCACGFTAVQMVQRERYDMVFMDYMMPEMNGVKAMQRIRSLSGEHWGLPIVALTANASPGTREALLSQGFHDYLHKPIEPSRLNEILRKWLSVEKRLRDTASAETRELPPAHAYDGFSCDGLMEEGVNARAGYACYGEKTYLDALHSYYAHVPALLEKLRRVDDLGEYLVAAHGLKGASYGIRADSLGRQAGALERAAQIGDARFIEANNDLLIATVENALRKLGAYLSAFERKMDAKPMAREPSPALLRELAVASRRCRTGEVENILDRLELYRYENGGFFFVKWLREQANNLEYGAIWKRLVKNAE